MRCNKSSLVVAVAGLWLFAATCHAQTAPLSEEQIADGWLALFDGETLYGWEPTSNANWTVEDGAIRADRGEAGFLMSTTEWADYQLHVEFRATANTNSGVFLRSSPAPQDPKRDCIEVNIAPRDNPFPTPSLVGRLRTPLRDGGYVPLSDGGYRSLGANEMPNPWDGQWHALEVKLQGNSCEVQIDGVIPRTYMHEESNWGLVGDELRRGRIGLQFREGPVAFRNVRIRPLNLKPIFNGKNLDGWNTKRAEASKFDVTDNGELQVTNGRGSLESDGQYGDFVLQFDCFVNGDGLNSGVFFRCIPDDYQNGYECQIHNGVNNGDPADPADFGTGGFYRRQRARRVNANDREWFSVTTVADGPHMASWVNGLQVSDWTDERQPDENPRRGLRTEAGTLQIQGHDPTTNLRFRNLRIDELPEEVLAEE